MAKKQGKVKRLNEIFAEIGLERIPDEVTRLDALEMLEEAGESLQVRGPYAPAEISETCGKACYRTQREARAVIQNRKRQGSGPLRDYFCEECACYHITSSV